jgi:signal transduction histidine kinase
MSLRALLTLPYVALLLVLAAVVGGLSYRSADQSVDDLAQRLSAEITQRISQNTENYLQNWHYVLAAAAVARWDSQAPKALAKAEEDLWHSSAVSLVRPSYVYLAAADGRFVGVQRPSAGPALLKLRETGQAGQAPKRELFEIDRPGERKRPLGLEASAYDATERPWYVRAASSQNPVWSPVYLDHASHQPMVTLARAFRFGDGPRAGQVSHVLGADVPLAHLQKFLEGLNIVPGGVAYVVTRDGKLVASSQAAHAMPSDAKALPSVAEHWDTLLVQTTQAVGTRLQQSSQAVNASFEHAEVGRMLVSASPMSAAAGMDWWVMVSLPDDVLMATARHNAYRTVALALLACGVAVALGAWVLNRLAADVARLTRAAEQLSLDAAPEPLRLSRGGELGRLALAFNRMATRLTASTHTVREQNLALARTVSDLEHQMLARDGADARLRRIADALQEGLLVMNVDWRVTFANARIEGYLKRSNHELVGMDVRDLFPGMEQSEFGQALNKAMRHNQAVAVEAPSLTLPDVWIGLRLFPTPFGIAGFFSDVTAERASRQALADREHQLSELSAELLRIQSEERRTIARELHDEFGQSLGALRISLQMTAASLPPAAAQQVALSDALEQASKLLNQVRNRSLDLHPVVLDDLGLLPALQWLCERQSQRSGAPVRLHAPPDMPRSDDAVELAGFRIVQEAVNNALKHAQASRIDVNVQLDRDLRIAITDDGQGLPDTARGEASVRLNSLGLTSMRERAQQLGGVLSISRAQPQGTTVRLTLPRWRDGSQAEHRTDEVVV